MAGGGDDNLLIALTGLRTRKKARQIAVELYGPERAAEWETDNWVRSRTRRQLDRARKFLELRQDYRAMVSGPG